MNTSLWVYLSTSPLLWLTGTLVVWAIAQMIFERANKNPILNPVLLSMLIIIPMLKLFAMPALAYLVQETLIHPEPLGEFGIFLQVHPVH